MTGKKPATITFVFVLAGCMVLAGWLLLNSGAVAAEGGSFPTDVIYTNLPGDPSSEVPGLPGVRFGPGTGTTHFDRVYGSPNGNWGFTADTDLPTTEDEVMIINHVIRAREGTSATWTTGELVGLLDTQLGVNDGGDYVFATNTDGPTTADEYIISGNGAVLTAVAQEGAATGLPALPGTTWGNTLDSPVVASDGTAGFSADVVIGVPTTEDDMMVYGTAVLAQEGVTVPPGQLGAEFWENFAITTYWVSADGTEWMVEGDLTGDTATDGVAAVNGSVVVQEGVILPGSTFTTPVDAAGIVGVHMAPGGDWFVRGNNDATELDWVYRNGAVIARRGDPIYAGSLENWSDADFADLFFLHVGDSAGNYVIGGVSDGPSLTNGVLVLNNTLEVVREGDPIDLDGNGSFDDDLFFDTFGNDDAVLTDAGLLYIVATVKDGTGTRTGQGIFTLDLSSVIGDPTATPTATPTDEPPTATSTATATPTDAPPTATSTATATATDEPPTATSTATPTDLPPTATATATDAPPTATATEPPPTATSTPGATGVELSSLSGEGGSWWPVVLVVGLIALALVLAVGARRRPASRG